MVIMLLIVGVLQHTTNYNYSLRNMNSISSFIRQDDHLSGKCQRILHMSEVSGISVRAFYPPWVDEAVPPWMDEF